MHSYNYSKEQLSRINERIFLACFSIVIVCKTLNLSVIADYTPYSAIYASYIFIWGIAALAKMRIKMKRSFSTKVMLSLLAFYVIWGLNNINNIDKEDAYGNLIRSILLVFFILVSCFWVKRFNCVDNLVKTLYYVFSIYLIVCLIIYLPEIHIFRTLRNFWSYDNNVRYRVFFGLRYPNIAAEMAVCAIILSKMIKSTDRTLGIIKRVINILMTLVVLANNSRGALLALFVFEILYFYLNNKGEKAVKRTWRWITIASSLIIVYIVYLVVVKNMSLLEILDGTNRQAALYENMKVVANSGRWLLGVGRLTGGFFSSKKIFYGAQTGYLEVFYFEIFITTGVIGSIFMTIILFYYIRGVVLCSRLDRTTPFGRWVFCVIIYMLFVSLFEVYFFSYIYESSMCLNVIVLSYVDLTICNMSNKKYLIENTMQEMYGRT